MTVFSEFFRIAKWRKDRRSLPRTSEPALLLITRSGCFETLDWSLGGCLIEVAHSTYKVGNQIEGTLEIANSGEQGEFLAEVVRVKEPDEVGLRWLEVSIHLFAEMASVKSV